MKRRIAVLVFFIVFLLIIDASPSMAQVNPSQDSTSVKADSLLILSSDSVLVLDSITSDSLVVPAKKSAINSKILYSASDSIIENVAERKVYLYGDAQVQYENITLEAAYIVYDFDSYTVHAEGVQDTLGNWHGKPIFTEGGSKFETDQINYNFNTKKGYIKGIQTQITEGYLTGETVKTTESGRITYIKKAEFCPCADPDAYTRFKISKLKVIKDDQIVSGPGYLALHGIPTPLAFPFGFFPNVDKQQAGLIIPSYGQAEGQGYFLNDGGFYLPLGEYFDTQILGDIYTRGSWGLSNITRYKKRYKFNGNFNISYNRLKSGDEDLGTANESSTFFITWSHAQDPKANPSSRFSASVNAGSTNRFTNDLNSSQENYLTNTFRSSIQYSNSFANSPWNLSASAKHSQNSQTGMFTFTLPDISVTRARTFPLDGIFNENPKQSWYEKIGISYGAAMQNRLTVHESQLRLDNVEKLLPMFQNGAQHNATASTSLKLGPVSLNPSINYRGRLAFKELYKEYNNELQQLQIDTLKKLNYNDDYNFSAQFTTKLYGMYAFRNAYIQAVRHTLTPSVSFTYTPLFENERYGYYGEDGSFGSYSPYDLSLYGGPPSGGPSGNINFSLSNNLEAKIASRRDSTNKFTKVSLIDNLSVRGSYNLFADSLKLSNISVSGRTKITRYLNLNANATFSPYKIVAAPLPGSDGTYRVTRINSYMAEDGGKIAEFIGGSLSLDAASFSNKSFGRNAAPPEEEVTLNEAGYIESEMGETDPEEEFEDFENQEIADDVQTERKSFIELFEDFTLPWTLQFGYSLDVRKNNFIFRQEDNSMLPIIMDTLAITNSIRFSGSVDLFGTVSLRFNSGYDFVMKEFTPTTLYAVVDLNCWEFAARVVPFGERRSYNLSLYIKSSLLRDLKIERNKTLTSEDKFFM